MLQLTGHLVFEPDRGPGFKKAGKLKTLILDLPNCFGVSLYYKAMIEREYGPWCNLSSPMFGAHVTVVRGNGDRFDEARLKSVVGRQVTVTVDPTKLERTPWSGSNPAFWTMPVVSPELEALRLHLRVKEIFPYKAHLTVARENSAFFMHVKADAEPIKLAKACLEAMNPTTVAFGTTAFIVPAQGKHVTVLKGQVLNRSKWVDYTAHHLKLGGLKADVKLVVELDDDDGKVVFAYQLADFVKRGVTRKNVRAVDVNCGGLELQAAGIVAGKPVAVPKPTYNQELYRELKLFIAKPNPLYRELVKLVYKHVSHPSKPWELDVVNLFRHPEGIAS